MIRVKHQSRRWLVPEVIQTSAMDCGPAALASLLNGLGQPISYPRLREACSTDVDGTAIDTLEDLCGQLGVVAEQSMLPADHVLLEPARSLPGIAVVELASGLNHFVVIWRALGGYLQIMDPARGRLWVRRQQFLDSLYRHRETVAVEDWLAYACSDQFQALVLASLKRVGIDAAAAAGHLEVALAAVQGDPEARSAAQRWQPLANLDAAARLLARLSLRGLDAAARNRALAQLLAVPERIPERYFQVRPVPDDPQQLRLFGAVVLRVPAEDQPAEVGGAAASAEAVHHARPTVRDRARGRLRIAVWSELKELLEHAGLSGRLRGLAGTAVLLGLATFFEALAYRYLIGLRPPTDMAGISLLALVVLLPLLATAAAEAGGMRLAQQLGRQLDLRLRTALLGKLPRVADNYFSSRLKSDLAERGHALAELREFPETGRRVLATACRLLFILAGLLWLAPGAWPLVLGMGAAALLAPLALQWFVAERDLRVRTHLGGLSRFYLDAMQGTEPIWAHGAEPAMSAEHEQLLVRWHRATAALQRPMVVFEALQAVGLVLLGATLVRGLWLTEVSLGTLLLGAYWALYVPMLSRQWLQLMRQLPRLRNVAGRVLELLNADEELQPDAGAAQKATDAVPLAPATALQCRDLVVAFGQARILGPLSLEIRAGERVAIVGASGSGKSSFLGVLMGWLQPSAGSLQVDGQLATPDLLADLRERSVCVDPSLYVWNRTLYANLLYGIADPESVTLGPVLAGSGFDADLPRMDAGLATVAGENASRLSGGEGQRLRLARALLRAGAPLVLLDEPFTGMDQQQRVRLHDAIAVRWPGATRLFVSHHVAETLDYDRVLVFAGGRVVEDGIPGELARQPESRFAALLAAERHLREDLAATPRWRHGELRGGLLEVS